MSRLNTSAVEAPVFTHEGGKGVRASQLQELRRSVLTCMLWEDTFYEKGNEIAGRIAELIRGSQMHEVRDLAIKARDKMQLRHVPLFLISELSKQKGSGQYVEAALAQVIQRADELTEFLAIYWQHGAREEGKKGKHPLAASVKRGLARAFRKFDAYRLAKYNRDSKIKLRDVLFLVHAKPKDEEQKALWKKLVDGTLESPDTWEVELSAGKDKKAAFERLLSEGKLGGLAVLRNLRNMQQVNVDESMIRARLAEGVKRALPFRFVTAARYAPTLEDAIEGAMFQGAADLPGLSGKTVLLVDVSGSMDGKLSLKSETTRVDAAAGLAILLREKAERVAIATFSENLAVLAPRRGFALRDAIQQSQPHSGTYLGTALQIIRAKAHEITLGDFDRLIVITDEQSADRIIPAWVRHSYIVNVAPYKTGVGYRDGWTHIDGWSERVLDYIREVETEPATSDRQ